MSSNGVARDVARHEEMIRDVKARLAKLENIAVDVAEIRAELQALKEDIKELRKNVERLEQIQQKQNGVYRWLIGLMITFSASFLALVGALLHELLKH